MREKVFGCKTNKYFAEKWADHPLVSEAEGIFVASCIVTDQAKARWVKFVKQSVKTLAPGEKVYLSGCASIRDGRIDPDFYERLPVRFSKNLNIWDLPQAFSNTRKPRSLRS